MKKGKQISEKGRRKEIGNFQDREPRTNLEKEEVGVGVWELSVLYEIRRDTECIG